MLRFGTYNVENLFDRPAILNLEDPKETSARLKQVDKLQKEITKASYNKERIQELLQDLKSFVTIRVDSGKFFKKGSGGAIQANGREDWEGAIEFKRAKFTDHQRKNTAAVIKALKADILCLVEVEGREALGDFSTAYFSGPARFPYNMLIDSPNDPRGIDIALQWKIGSLGILRSNAYDTSSIDGKVKRIFSRDCLEVELVLPSGKSLYVLCNHFKSKMGGDPPEAVAKRTAQAKRVAEIERERYDLSKDYVIIAGDLNDTPDSAPLKPLLQANDLHDVFDIVGRSEADRWTYYYKRSPVAKRRTQIDFVLVSDALKSKVKSVDVFRRGMSAVAEGEIDGVEPLKGISSWRDAASDHAAILVDIDI